MLFMFYLRYNHELLWNGLYTSRYQWNHLPVQEPEERLLGLEYFPGGHFSHVLDISLLWNLPFGHMLHGFSPVSENSPSLHVSISKHLAMSISYYIVQ